MKIRRVTTGHNAAGKAVFVSDTEVEGDAVALLNGAIHGLWGADQLPEFPNAGIKPTYNDYFPPLGGFRFITFTLEPASASATTQGDPQTMMNDFMAKMPGAAEHLELNSPGMHTSDTIDFEYIISGEVWLELDDCETIHLRAGDTVVQNGTRHAWHNKGTEPCHIVAFMVGVHRNPSGIDVARNAA